jgi:hypothetical protein
LDPGSISMRRSFTFPIFRLSRSSVYEPTPYSAIPISISFPSFPRSIIFLLLQL